MADSLITPAVATPKGVPPKKLVIGIFVGVVLSALVLHYVSTPEPPAAASGGALAQQARERRAQLSESERGAVGQVAASALQVRQAESDLPASLRPKPAAHTAAAVANPVGATPQGTQPASPLPAGHALPPGVPASPASTAPLPVSGGPLKDSGEAAREVEIMNSKLVVFEDAGATGGSPDASPLGSDIERQIAAARAAAASGGPMKDQAQIAAEARQEAAAAAAKAQAQQERMLAQQGRQGLRDQVFVKEFSEQAAQPALRPNRQESPRMILEGTVIPAVLTRDINSDLPGVITATVSRDVFDTLTARQKLVCKGARLVGRYSSDIAAGQSRLLFAFNRMILPDGSSYDLGGFNGSDQAGRGGVEGEVDNHYVRIFGTSLLIGLLADRVARPQVTPQGESAQRSATGEIMVNLANEHLNRFKSVPTTISLERGTPINVEVRRDLLVPAAAARACQ